MLRPVPSRLPGPVDPAEARAFVASSLPSIDEAAAAAFSSVVLGGLPRSSVPGLSSGEVPTALARARKEVRRRAVALPGSGWCERAERLISDRLDDALDEPRLLDAHLANCPRCVEHERRLVLAQDALVASFSAAHLSPTPPALPAPEPPALKVIEEPVAAPAAVAEPEPAPAPRRQLSITGLAWGALAVLATLLTLAAVALTVAGALGAGL